MAAVSTVHTVLQTDPGASIRRVVLALTDEEIDVLTDGADDVVVLPHLLVLDRFELVAARRAAERSLAARGILLPPEPPTPQDTAENRPVQPQDQDRLARVHDDLAVLLEVRSGAPVVAVLHRTLTRELSSLRSTGDPESSLTRYLFVIESACVCEDVTATGVHTLSIARSSDVRALLHEFLVPPGARAPSDEHVVVADPAELPQALSSLADPVMLAETTVLHPWLRPGEAPGRLLFLGPGGCFHADLDDSHRWLCSPASPETIVALIGEEIDRATQRVVAEM